MQTRLFRVVAGLIWLTVAIAFAQQSPPGACSVSGDVVDEAGQPVGNVNLLLFPADEQKWAAGRESKLVQWTVVDAGAFKLTGFPPGEYRLAVTPDKVVEGGPDAAFIKVHAPRALPLPVSAGEQAQVRLVVNADLNLVRAQRSGMQVVSSGLASSPTLPAGPGGRVSGPPGPPAGPRGPGAISGIVIGADGQPIAGAHIQRFTSPLRNGVPQLSPTGPAATTDELGEYHLTGIVAGEYVVAALAQSFDFSAPGAATVNHMPPSVAGSDGQKIGYVTTYYPGTAAAARATKVTVGVTEVTAINFTLQRQPMTDVTGTISGTSALAFDDAVVLLPESQAYGGGAPDARRIPISRDGAFAIPDLPFGLYVLNFTSARGWAHETFVVSANLAPLAITLKPPLVVKGRVEFLGDMPAPTGASLSPFRIRLTPAVLVTGSRLFEVPISATGEFTLPGVSAGRYILQSRTTPPWTEMSGRLGGEDTLDTPVEITANRDDAVVVLVDREAGISGTVKQDRDALYDALVVVYSADRQYWTSGTRRIRVSRIVGGGGFSVAGLPPGQYLAFALPLSTDTPAVNNALLEKYQGRAQRFELVAREHRTIEIQMIREPLSAGRPPGVASNIRHPVAAESSALRCTMPPLQIAERRVGDVTFLTLAGRLILDEGENPLRTKVDALIRERRIDVVVDLHDVTYLDSCGVGALVEKCVSLRKAGGDLMLLCPSERCRRTLEITGLLLRVFEVYDTEDAALSRFEARHSGNKVFRQGV